jgi:hypothetical protein
LESRVKQNVEVKYKYQISDSHHGVRVHGNAKMNNNDQMKISWAFKPVRQQDLFSFPHG